MRSASWRSLVPLLALCALLACGRERRAPPPTVTVEVHSAYEFVLDGETMDRGELRQHLQELADEHRRPIVHNSRVYMHIIGSGPGTGAEVQSLMSYCMSIGLDKIRVGR